jgi:hypothetical protein
LSVAGDLGWEVEDFDPLGAPFTGRILSCRHLNLLAGAKAIKIALVPLAERHFFSKYDHRMQDFHAAKHSILALNEDPATGQRLCERRVNYPSAKSAISSLGWPACNQQYERKTQHPGHSHPHYDAKPQNGVL